MHKYYAKVDLNNIVTDVIVSDDEFISSLEGTWVETDINGVSPKNYAGIGFTYNSQLNGFIPVKPFNSWLLNEETCLWEPPTPYPNDGLKYNWNEEQLIWELI